MHAARPQQAINSDKTVFFICMVFVYIFTNLYNFVRKLKQNPFKFSIFAQIFEKRHLL